MLAHATFNSQKPRSTCCIIGLQSVNYTPVFNVREFESNYSIKSVIYVCVNEMLHYSYDYELTTRFWRITCRAIMSNRTSANNNNNNDMHLISIMNGRLVSCEFNRIGMSVVWKSPFHRNWYPIDAACDALCIYDFSYRACDAGTPWWFPPNKSASLDFRRYKSESERGHQHQSA